MASSSDTQGAASDARTLKRQLGVAEETVRIKKERLEEAEEAHDEDHRTFTTFSTRLQEKWEQRFDALAALAADAGVPTEDIAAIRLQPWQATRQEAVAADAPADAAPQEAAAQAEADEQNAMESAAQRAAIREQCSQGRLQRKKTRRAMIEQIEYIGARAEAEGVSSILPFVGDLCKIVGDGRMPNDGDCYSDDDDFYTGCYGELEDACFDVLEMVDIKFVEAFAEEVAEGFDNDQYLTRDDLGYCRGGGEAEYVDRLTNLVSQFSLHVVQKVHATYSECGMASYNALRECAVRRAETMCCPECAKLVCIAAKKHIR